MANARSRRCRLCGDGEFLWAPKDVGPNGECPVCGTKTDVMPLTPPHPESHRQKYLEQYGPGAQPAVEIKKELDELDARQCAEWDADWQILEGRGRLYGGCVGLADLLDEMADERLSR